MCHVERRRTSVPQDRGAGGGCQPAAKHPRCGPSCSAPCVLIAALACGMWFAVCGLWCTVCGSLRSMQHRAPRRAQATGRCRHGVRAWRSMTTCAVYGVVWYSTVCMYRVDCGIGCAPCTLHHVAWCCTHAATTSPPAALCTRHMPPRGYIYI